MIKRLAFALIFGACASMAADSVIRRLVWQVETSDPVARNWSMVYGETADMEVRFLDHAAAMDLAGSSVVLHCRTNGQSEGFSFQATGSVMAVKGWATVRVNVDRVLPQGLTEASYVLAATVGGSTNLLSASGKLKLSGTGMGINSAALPSLMAADLYDQISNALAVARAAGDSFTMLDSADTNLFLRMEWGTNWVYRASGASTSRVGRVVLQDELAALSARVDGVIIPSNTVGWLLWDSGSNDWLRVTATNRLLFVDVSDYQPGMPLVTTNGLATPVDLTAATNGLARWSDVQSATSGLARASITNGLLGASALEAYAPLSVLYSATSGLATASALSAYTPTASLYALTSGLANVSWTAAQISLSTSGLALASSVAGSTNGLARLVDVQAATSGLARVSVTNGLLGTAALAEYTPTASLYALTSGLANVSWTAAQISLSTSVLALASSVAGSTNGLSRLVDVQAATSGLARVSVTNGLLAAAALAEYTPTASLYALTSGLANASWTAAQISLSTSGLALASSVAGSTNGLARLVDVQAATSGLARVSITNGLLGSVALAEYTPTASLYALTSGLARVSITNGLLGSSAIGGLLTADALAAATSGVLRAEADTLASVAARGAFAGTEIIAPLRVAAQAYGGTNVAYNAAGSGYLAIGGGLEASGDRWTALGWHAGDYASGDYGLYLGAWAGRNTQANGQIHIGSYLSDPGADHDPINDAFVYDPVTRETYIGVTGGVTYLRGTVSLTNMVSNIDPSVTNGLASIAYVSLATQNLVTAAITNGLGGSSVSASITNGLASIAYVSLATQNLVTAAITNGLGGSSVSASITNGLASTNFVNGLVDSLNAMTPLAVTNIVSTLVEGAVGVSAEAVTNISSTLLFSYANPSGFTTQQIWRVGSGTVTNFFSRAGATGETNSYTEGDWTRPSDWPIGATYSSVAQWRSCESNVCKIVVVADELEFFYVDTDGGNYWVDWDGDGTFEQQWADNTVCSNIYSGADINALKPIVIRTYGSTNLVSVRLVNVNTPTTPTISANIYGARRMGALEFIAPLNQTVLSSSAYQTKMLESARFDGATSSDSTVFDYATALKQIICPKIISIASQGFQHCYDLRSLSMPALTNIQTYAFRDNPSLRSVYLPNLQTLPSYCFQDCYGLADIGTMTNLTGTIGVSIFSGCTLNFSPMTNFFLNLPARSTLATIPLSGTVSASEIKAWYIANDFAVSNQLNSLNWKLSF